MAKKKKRPELVHCKVTFTTHPKAPWRVSYPAEREGKPVRLRKSYAKEESARTFAEDTEREISNHGIRFGDIPPEVRRAFDFYRDEVISLADLGATVPRFEDLVSSSLAAIRTAFQTAGENTVTVAEGVALFVDYKRTRVGTRQLTNLKDQLKRFALDYGTRHMPSITTQELETWLASLRSRRNPEKLALPPLLAPVSRNHHRATLHAFFSHAATKGRAWCQHNPVSDMEAEKVKATEPEAYTPEEVRKIMQTALEQKPQLLPVLALGVFCGLRVSEAVEIDLSKITAGTVEFRVTGKTGPRLVPCTDACKAWLFAQPRRTAKASIIPPKSLINGMRELFVLAKVDQIHNGARHSFISYRTAEIRDVARVADECGNSVLTIKNHYRKLVNEDAAKEFFAIRPEKKRGRKSKITNIETGRKSA
jgi:integrase